MHTWTMFSAVLNQPGSANCSAVALVHANTFLPHEPTGTHVVIPASSKETGGTAGSGNFHSVE